MILRQFAPIKCESGQDPLTHGRTNTQERYPERFAQAALGHTSKAVHQAYAKRAKVICPSLEDYEAKIVPMPPQICTLGHLGPGWPDLGIGQPTRRSSAIFRVVIASAARGPCS
jgi:hypothetical protein